MKVTQPKKAQAISALYPRRTNKVIIGASHNHIYSPFCPSKHPKWDLAHIHTTHTYPIQST